MRYIISTLLCISCYVRKCFMFNCRPIRICKIENWCSQSKICLKMSIIFKNRMVILYDKCAYSQSRRMDSLYISTITN